MNSIQTNLGERGQGIGSTLLAAVIGWGKSKGARRLTGEFAPDCTVNPEEVAAWYRKRGIEIDDDGNLVGEIK